MQVPVFILFLIEFLGQELSPLIGPTKDNALVDDQLGVQLVNCFHLVAFIQEHVVMGEPDEHELFHEIDDLGFGHELLLEGLDADGEGGGVHEQGAFGVEVAHQLLHIPFEVAFQQSVSLIQDKEIALRQQFLVSFQQIFQPSRRAYCQMHAFLLYRVVVLLDQSTTDEIADFYLGEL